MPFDLRKADLRFVRVRRDIHLQKPAPYDFELFVRHDDLFGLAASIEIGEPPLNLLVKADNAGGDVVGRELVQALQQPFARRLLLSLQDRQMICVKQHRHKRLPLELSLPDEPAEAADFRKCFVAGKGADNFAIPAFAGLGRERRFEFSFEFSQLLLDTMEPCLQSICVTRHCVIISRAPSQGK